jgi:hypothetical protein
MTGCFWWPEHALLLTCCWSVGMQATNASAVTAVTDTHSLAIYLATTNVECVMLAWLT